jgi:hypothetical protein
MTLTVLNAGYTGFVETAPTSSNGCCRTGRERDEGRGQFVPELGRLMWAPGRASIDPGCTARHGAGQAGSCRRPIKR